MIKLKDILNEVKFSKSDISDISDFRKPPYIYTNTDHKFKVGDQWGQNGKVIDVNADGSLVKLKIFNREPTVGDYVTSLFKPINIRHKEFYVVSINMLSDDKLRHFKSFLGQHVPFNNRIKFDV